MQLGAIVRDIVSRTKSGRDMENGRL
jgi:hypothetical protein